MNRKILVIYLSKTGFTERYARWIGQALPCDLVPYQKGTAFARRTMTLSCSAAASTPAPSPASNGCKSGSPG